jgi:hypothetical protein
MRSLYRLRLVHTLYVGSGNSIDQFHQAGVVRITNGGLAIWLHPFGMLDPQVVVNLLPKLAIGVDLVRHASKGFKDAAGVLRQRLGRMVDQR